MSVGRTFQVTEITPVFAINYISPTSKKSPKLIGSCVCFVFAIAAIGAFGTMAKDISDRVRHNHTISPGDIAMELGISGLTAVVLIIGTIYACIWANREE